MPARSAILVVVCLAATVLLATRWLATMDDAAIPQGHTIDLDGSEPSPESDTVPTSTGDGTTTTTVGDVPPATFAPTSSTVSRPPATTPATDEHDDDDDDDDDE
jgi:hypothetical protein